MINLSIPIMKTFLFACYFLGVTRCIDTPKVYICNSKSSTKYHLKSDCRGLSDCSYRIIETTLNSVVNSNRTICKWEKFTSAE